MKFNNMLPTKSLSSHIYKIDNSYDIYIGYDDNVYGPSKISDFIKVKESKKISPEDSLKIKRHLLINKAERVFGRGISITGSKEKGWNLTIRPTRKEHRFSESSFHFTDFEEANKKLDKAIENYQSKIG